MNTMMYIIAAGCIALAVGGMIWFYVFCNGKGDDKKDSEDKKDKDIRD